MWPGFTAIPPDLLPGRPIGRDKPLLLLPRDESHQRGAAALARLLSDFDADRRERGEVLDAECRKPCRQLFLGCIAFRVGNLGPVLGD
jgi:hypothetical protein